MMVVGSWLHSTPQLELLKRYLINRRFGVNSSAPAEVGGVKLGLHHMHHPAVEIICGLSHMEVFGVEHRGAFMGGQPIGFAVFIAQFMQLIA